MLSQLLREHQEHEFGAQYDSVSERYASELEDLRINDMIEADHQEYMRKVWDAGFGTDEEAYEAYWNRTLAYDEQTNNL